MEAYCGQIHRVTGETDIDLALSLYGGDVSVSTGVGFFDHMLRAFAVHGGFGLQVKAIGDWEVDCHHTIEDTGIALGRAFAQAVGDHLDMARFGHACIPMDEALAFAAVDLGGRSFFLLQGQAFPQERVGDFDTCMTEEFFRALALNGAMTLHLDCRYGKNSHHMIEALFKAAGHALHDAAALTGREGMPLSTKGVL